jgi:cytochrome oxidase Cu insertion factor (SCO1/SenC/PrrC family)
MMKRRDTLRAALLGAFAAVAVMKDAQGFDWFKSKPKTTEQSAAGLRAGNPQIGGRLDDLQHNGKPVGGRLDGQFKLIYFGTSYRLPNCSADLMVLQEVMRSVDAACGAGKVAGIMVYPAHDPAKHPPAQNISQYIDVKGSRLTGLSGTQQQVMELARQYKARYFTDASGMINNHTRFAYLMSPEGKNILIAPADLPPDMIAQGVLEAMKAVRPDLGCGPIPR